MEVNEIYNWKNLGEEIIDFIKITKVLEKTGDVIFDEIFISNSTKRYIKGIQIYCSKGFEETLKISNKKVWYKLIRRYKKELEIIQYENKEILLKTSQTTYGLLKPNI